MDNSSLISNILNYCAAVKKKPTFACTEAGVGKSFVSTLRNGVSPSVAKVADLAAYLGVSTSDLVGDAATPAVLAPLADAWAELNDEGRERLIEYAEDLVRGGRYIKNRPDRVQKEA